MGQTTRLKLWISQVFLLLSVTNGELMRLISIPERSRSALKGISTTFQDYERVLYRIVYRRVIDYVFIYKTAMAVFY